MNQKNILLSLLLASANLMDANHKKLISEAYAVLVNFSHIKQNCTLGNFLLSDSYVMASRFAHDIKYMGDTEGIKSAIADLKTMDLDLSKSLTDLDCQLAQYKRLSDEIAAVRAELLVRHSDVRRLMGAAPLIFFEKSK